MRLMWQGQSCSCPESGNRCAARTLAPGHTCPPAKVKRGLSERLGSVQIGIVSDDHRDPPAILGAMHHICDANALELLAARLITDGCAGDERAGVTQTLDATDDEFASTETLRAKRIGDALEHLREHIVSRRRNRALRSDEQCRLVEKSEKCLNVQRAERGVVVDERAHGHLFVHHMSSASFLQL